jgi:hypothetical protein
MDNARTVAQIGVRPWSDDRLEMALRRELGQVEYMRETDYPLWSMTSGVLDRLGELSRGILG